MEKRCGDGLGVEAEFHQNLRHGARMDEIRLPRSALLVLVRRLRKIIGIEKQIAVVARVKLIDLHEDGFHTYPSRKLPTAL